MAEKGVGVNKKIIILLLFLMLFSLCGCGRTKVRLNPFLTIKLEGENGNGEVSYEFDFEAYEKKYKHKIRIDTNNRDWSWEELQDEKAYVKENGGACQMLYDDCVFGGSFDNESGLSNGDVVTFSWDVDDDYSQEYYYARLVYSDIKYKVSGLAEGEAFNPFDHITVIFEGEDSSGSAYIETDEDCSEFDYIEFEVENDGELKNGDVITIRASVYDEEGFLEEYGALLSTTEMTYEVSGLESDTEMEEEVEEEEEIVEEESEEDSSEEANEEDPSTTPTPTPTPTATATPTPAPTASSGSNGQGGNGANAVQSGESGSNSAGQAGDLDNIDISALEAKGYTKNDILDSGKCGDDVRWFVAGNAGNATLLLDGKGSTYDFSSDGAPAEYLEGRVREKYSIKNLEVLSGVTGIGSRAFYGLDSINTAVLPEGLTKIGHHAFYECRDLNGITLPESLTEIGAAAFGGSGLSSLFIPGNVSLIGEGYEESYSNNKTAGIVMNCTSLQKLEVASENHHYDSRSACNAIIDTENDRIIDGCAKTTVPDSVTSIGNYAFSGSAIKKIKLPSGLTSIGEGAFEKSSLEYISIPDSVNYIGLRAFQECKNLEAAGLPSSMSDITDFAFYGATRLRVLLLPKEIRTIADEVFSGTEQTVDIYYEGDQSQAETLYIGGGSFQQGYNIHYGYTGDLSSLGYGN